MDTNYFEPVLQNSTNSVFNRLAHIQNVNYIYQFRDNQSVFTKIKAQTNGWTDRETNIVINTFQLRWNEDV